MTLSISESLLPQPPSFQKKKAYAIHKVLGVGTFGKVMVSPFPLAPARHLHLRWACSPRVRTHSNHALLFILLMSLRAALSRPVLIRDPDGP